MHRSHIYIVHADYLCPPFEKGNTVQGRPLGLVQALTNLYPQEEINHL
jgi:hypothetical protein